MGKAACGTCHFAPTFSGLVPPQFDETEAEVLGVPTQPQAPHELDPDWGRGGGLLKFQSEIYRHAFKTVTVRNIAHTAPYFHNGAYNTLEEVVDFYNNGGGVGLGLDVPNQTLPADSLHLSDQEQKDLIAFMQALTGQPLP
jgi:cytochrome c peroxidase